eukprot:Opistho-2@44148
MIAPFGPDDEIVGKLRDTNSLWYLLNSSSLSAAVISVCVRSGCAISLSIHAKNAQSAAASRMCELRIPLSSAPVLRAFESTVGSGDSRILFLGTSCASPSLHFGPSHILCCAADASAARSSATAEYGRTCMGPASPPRRCTRAAVSSLELSTYSAAESHVTIAYAMKTGVYSTSLPRKLKSHATSSSALTTSASHRGFLPPPAMAARSSVSFCECDLPVFSRGRGNMRPDGAPGRSPPHTASTRLRLTATRDMRPSRRRCFSNWRNLDAGTRKGSTPMTLPSASTRTSHSGCDGVSGVPIRISCQLSSSCISACKKYRPSVHNAALSKVTMAAPADPVNPEMKARRLSCSARYSLWCASSGGTR